MTTDAAEVRALLASREVRLLEHGIKPVAKLEVTIRHAEVIGRSLERDGFTAIVVDAQPPTNIEARRGDVAEGAAVVVSRTAALAHEAAALVAIGAAEQDPARLERLGALLGYPACCVRAFARWSAQTTDDVTCLGLALLATQRAVDPALDPWAPWGGIEYLPCALDCASSRSRVDRAIAAGAISPVEAPEARGAQLVLSALTRVCLRDAAFDGSRLRYTRAHVVGAQDPVADGLSAALAEGDAIALGDGRLEIHGSGSPVATTSAHGMLAYVPGALLPASWARVWRGDPSDFEAEIVIPLAPTPALRARVTALLAGLPRRHEVLDARGEGRVLLMDGGEYAFFRGTVEPGEGGDRVTIASLHRTHMPAESPRRRVHAGLRSATSFFLPHEGAPLRVVVFRSVPTGGERR